MLKSILGLLWTGAPVSFRRLAIRVAEPKFTVTAGAVITDRQGRVLLLKHAFRKGSGWGIPGGFLEKGEQPEEALRRELREEVSLELDRVDIAFARALKRPQQIEIIFVCTCNGEPVPTGTEIVEAKWFERESLPAQLSQDQQALIARALASVEKNSRPAETK
jgi:8-oxo-dGTP diphosphatase